MTTRMFAVKNLGSLLTHLECSSCNAVHDHSTLQTVCTRCGKSLFARYDMELARSKLSKDLVKGRESTLWRFQELLPVLDGKISVSLGEGNTPIMQLRRLGAELGLPHLWMKDEAFNATGSFKARGLCMAVSKALELGVREFCIPTAGNAGSALAAYAAAAGLNSHVYMPEDTPEMNIHECRAYGADVRLVRGVISDAARVMREEKKSGWFDVSTLKEPYRLEGKKTLGYEIAEQFDWRLPDVIIYPTGGGTGLIGMWKGFSELEELGWIHARRPKMVAVQSTGCAPIVRAFVARSEVSEPWENASTIASGIRVPKAFADSLILRTLYESGGLALAVTDHEILRAVRRVAQLEGLLLCPEGAATVAALQHLKDDGLVSLNSTILVLNTGSGLKYSEVLRNISS